MVNASQLKRVKCIMQSVVRMFSILLFGVGGSHSLKLNMYSCILQLHPTLADYKFRLDMIYYPS